MTRNRLKTAILHVFYALLLIWVIHKILTAHPDPEADTMHAYP